VRALPELRGRVATLDLEYWSEAHLRQIGTKGFDVLGTILPEEVISKLAKEAAGSPQLMQSLCLHACFELEVLEGRQTKLALTVGEATLDRILEKTASTTNFRSLVEILDSGPKTRGAERKTYQYKEGGEGDVYRTVLRAISSDPPRLSFDYKELTERVRQICVGDVPVGSSIVGSCGHMASLALEKSPNERALDWDEQKQVIDIADPFLAFYLRWSSHLR
jgi:hypothetical protein